MVFYIYAWYKGSVTYQFFPRLASYERRWGKSGGGGWVYLYNAKKLNSKYQFFEKQNKYKFLPKSKNEQTILFLCNNGSANFG